MTQEQKIVSKWILIVTAIFAAMELMVSVCLCVAPQSVVETVDLGAKGVDYVIQMWAARQFALGVIFAFAVFKRSVPMLTLAYVFFLVMFLGDLLIGISQNQMAQVMSAVVMCAIASGMLYAINRKR